QPDLAVRSARAARHGLRYAHPEYRIALRPRHTAWCVAVRNKLDVHGWLSLHAWAFFVAHGVGEPFVWRATRVSSSPSVPWQIEPNAYSGKCTACRRGHGTCFAGRLCGDHRALVVTGFRGATLDSPAYARCNSRGGGISNRSR